MARSNLSLRWVPTVLAPPAGIESGGSFTDRSHPGMTRSNLSLRWVPTVLCPPSRLRKRRQFHRSQPPRDGEI
eukprot:4874452-Pyramimonas_sp.AAC.1